MAKSPDAFRTISEVSAFLDTQPHVLRFWETKFEQLKPVKRAGGRRYYRPGDVALLLGIKSLLHEQGMTIRGVQKMLREQGARHVASLAAPAGAGVAGVILGPWAGPSRGPMAEADLDEDLGFEGEFDDEEPEDEEVLDGAVADDSFKEDAEEPLAGSEAPTLIEAFLEGTLSRLAQEGTLVSGQEDAGAPEETQALPAPLASAPLPSRAKPTLDDALALLRRADPERLRAQAPRIAPLVARLRALRADLAPPPG